jgi:hypothetical protein
VLAELAPVAGAIGEIVGFGFGVETPHPVDPLIVKGTCVRFE